MAGVYKEIWTGEVEKKFRAGAGFLNIIPDRSDWVGNGVIHATELGADPDVLVDNTTYPIAVAGRNDADVTYSLKKLDTENTKVTDDELYAISYDKMRETVDLHASALIEKVGALAAYSLSPAGNSLNHPVFKATGSIVGGRRQLSISDLVKLKKSFDLMKVPQANRALVLCPEHVSDLLLTNQTFERQYSDIREGRILKLHGFDIYEYTENTYYKEATLLKNSFGAVPGAGDVESSFAFYAPKMVKAMGNGPGRPVLQMYYRDAKVDPENRQSVVGFSTRFLCIPRTDKYYAAIIGATS